MTNDLTNGPQISSQFINSNIYVSFSTRDRDFGAALCREMDDIGLKVSCDSFNVTDTKYKNTADSVAYCDIFVAVMSRSYLKSPICKDELMFAFSLKKEMILIYEGGIAPNLPLAIRLALVRTYDTTDYKSTRALVYDVFTEVHNGEDENAPRIRGVKEKKSRPMRSDEEIIKFDNGSVYTGTVANGVPEGIGRLEYSDGGYYEGAFSGGEPEGHGMMKYADGDSYDGEFSLGVADGRGSYRFKNGDVYVGEIKGGIFSGRGSMYFSDGNTYHGEFQDDLINGKGVFRLADGSVYEGDFVDGNYSGRGRFRFFSGDEYEGDFYDGSFDGVGIYRSAKGEIYRGQFENDKRHGKGVLIKGGVKYGVEYKNGRLVSKTKI